MRVVLYHPEIPGNTGALMRLAANTGTELHLIRPLGFSLDEPALRRAGLDYREWADVVVHDALLPAIDGRRVFALTVAGETRYTDVEFDKDDVLLFGPESVGLPSEVASGSGILDRLRIPMQPDSRSINLANSVSIVLYEALRQQGFPRLS